MDATCNVQDSIHVFHLVHNMCPGFWVHIKTQGFCDFLKKYHTLLLSMTSKIEAVKFST